MNRFYLAFPELGFQTSYFVSVNTLVIEQCWQDLLQLRMPRFLSWRSRNCFREKPPAEVMFLHTTYTGAGFSRDVRGRLWEGATVTFVALQLAYYMGFEEVILVGVDHSFSAQGKPNQTVVSQGDDADHFDKGYFGKGFRWQLPDLDTSEQGYRMARKIFTAAGRRVLDATVGGKLEVFPKVEFDKVT
jgi:hypothetical protein